VQLNLPGFDTAIINNTQAPLGQVRLDAQILRLDGTRLAQRAALLDVPAGEVASGPALPLADLLRKERALLVALTLTDRQGRALSRNLYWQTQEDADGQRLADMPAQPVTVAVASLRQGSETHLRLTVRNQGAAPALAIKLTLLKADGTRMLPAYYSDNYVSLLPHESREIEVSFAGEAHGACTVRGWNAQPARVTF
jgi:hypothetical protein